MKLRSFNMVCSELAEQTEKIYMRMAFDGLYVLPPKSNLEEFGSLVWLLEGRVCSPPPIVRISRDLLPCIDLVNILKGSTLNKNVSASMPGRYKLHSRYHHVKMHKIHNFCFQTM